MPTPILTTTLSLPFQFDKHKLQAETEKLLASKWFPHFNTQGYEGAWNSLALYAQDGDPSNIQIMGNTELKPTPLLQGCPYLQEVIGQFKCTLQSVRLLRLGVGALIKPHRDHELGYEDGNFRIHIPIFTNSGINFTLNEVRLEMKEGECWYTNVNYIHSVSNKGKTDRIHLVIDGERNDWSDNIFFSLAPKESFFPEASNDYPIAVMQQMISELKLMDTEGARETIKELTYKIEQSGK